VARHSPNSQLVALLVEARWSSGELARAVNALGTVYGIALCYDRTSVAHWLTGSRPRPPVPDLAAQALSRRCERHVTAADTGLSSSSTSQAPLVPEPHQEVSPVFRLSALCKDDMDPARRAVLTRTVYGLGAIILPTWSEPPPPPALRPRGHRASQADAARLREMTRTFARLHALYGGGHARTALAAYLAEDVSLLLTASAPAALHSQLLSLGAQLTHQLASMTVDAGQHGLAQRYYRISLSLARESAGRATYAITLRAMSGQALELGHVRHAAELAEVAVATGHREAPAVRAYLLSQHALTQATHLRTDAALSLLDQAEREHDGSTNTPGPFTSYPRSGLDYHRARTLSALGRHTEALSAWQAALRHRSPAERKPYSLTQARIAEALLAVRQVEGACDHWGVFLDHYPHLRSAKADLALTTLIQQLGSFPRLASAAGVRKRALAVRHQAIRA
jgi:tetratricopeptide (TPR) repeat protein